MIKKLIKNSIFIFDPVFALFAAIGFIGVISRVFMISSNKKLPLTRTMFHKCGYIPIRDHYYEPLTFYAVGSKYRDRVAKKIFNGKKDFEFLRSIALPQEFVEEYNNGVLNDAGFKFGNGSFESGDAEVLYYFVRYCKPNKIVEIGAGVSSIIIQAALKLNEVDGFYCDHIIIEPYENPWLESLKATVIRHKVETVDFSIFNGLVENDMLFIDSSHVIRAQNDCVFEYTELLPSLSNNVFVHIHDIFTPYDYPDEWLNKDFRIWGEQYILESLLANGDNWKILAPLNWLSKDIDSFKSICPFFDENRIPGSMWIVKR